MQNADRNTILAALRFYQQHGQGDPANRSDEINDIATDGDEDIALDDAGIDRLCEQLNCCVSLFVYIQVYLKPGKAPMPTFDHTFIQAADVDEAYLIGQRECSAVPEHLAKDGYARANDYVVPCGPLLQHAYQDFAALVLVRGGVATVVNGGDGNVRVLDLDDVEAGGPLQEFPRGVGFEELLADLEAGKDYKWEDA